MTALEEYRTIPLTQGQIALVDADDYWWLMQWKWTANYSKFTRSFYAIRGEVIGYKKIRGLKMHRVILGLETGDPRTGDHINGNTLDNRRFNLRICSRAENTRNSGVRMINKSGFKGVTQERSKWVAHICVNYKKIRLGIFLTPEEAHRAYRDAAIRFHGEFARF